MARPKLAARNRLTHRTRKPPRPPPRSRVSKSGTAPTCSAPRLARRILRPLGPHLARRKASLHGRAPKYVAHADEALASEVRRARGKPPKAASLLRASPLGRALRAKSADAATQKAYAAINQGETAAATNAEQQLSTQAADQQSTEQTKQLENVGPYNQYGPNGYGNYGIHYHFYGYPY